VNDAATVDGCGPLGVFWRIIFPLLRPALAVTAVFTFIWTWNDFLGPLIYLTATDNYTVSIALNAFLDSTGTSNWGAMFAMSQSNANKWIQVLLPSLHQALSDLGDVPARHLLALQQRLTELEATAPQTAEAAPAGSPFFTMAPNDRSPAPRTRMNKARVIAARKSAIR